MFTFCFAFDVCSGAWQTRSTRVCSNDCRLYHAAVETTAKQRRNARHKIHCGDTRGWLYDMDNVRFIVKYINIRFLFVCSCFSSACGLLVSGRIYHWEISRVPAVVISNQKTRLVSC